MLQFFFHNFLGFAVVLISPFIIGGAFEIHKERRRKKHDSVVHFLVTDSNNLKLSNAKRINRKPRR